MEFSLVTRGFKRNVSLVEAHADGISHEDSLTQTPYNVNCFNWVVGHMITSRNALFRNIAGEELWSTEDGLDRYRRESEPITEDGPGVWKLADLLAALGESQESRSTVAPPPARPGSSSATSTTPTTPANSTSSASCPARATRSSRAAFGGSSSSGHSSSRRGQSRSMPLWARLWPEPEPEPEPGRR
jgi:hypothetical protein